MNCLNRPYTFAMLALCLCLSGCSVYVVKKTTTGGDHQGIPFYVTTAGCKREITRLKPYLVITLTGKEKAAAVKDPKDAKVMFVDVKAVCRTDFYSDKLDKLRRASNLRQLSAAWTDVKALVCEPRREDELPGDYAPSHCKPGEGCAYNAMVVSDVISAYTYVDYANPYTLNVNRPIAGTASATTKLNTDGTLSEGTASVDDETLSTLANAATSVLTAGATTGTSTAAAAPAALIGRVAAGPSELPDLDYELKVEEKATKLTRTYRDPAFHDACWSDPRLNPAHSGEARPAPALDSDLVISDVSDGDSKSPDNAIKVNGTIELPKKDDAKAGGGK